MKQCPRCGIHSDDGIDLCDCGYRFSTKQLESTATAYRTLDGKPPPKNWRVLDAVGGLFLMLSVRAVGVPQLSSDGSVSSASQHAGISGVLAAAAFGIGYYASSALTTRVRRSKSGQSAPMIVGLLLGALYVVLGLVAMIVAGLANSQPN